MTVESQPSVIITPSQEDIDKIRGYRITKWKHFDNFECIYCQYATLWLPKMEKHQAHGEHPWAYPTPGSADILSECETSDGPEY